MSMPEGTARLSASFSGEVTGALFLSDAALKLISYFSKHDGAG